MPIKTHNLFTVPGTSIPLVETPKGQRGKGAKGQRGKGAKGQRKLVSSDNQYCFPIIDSVPNFLTDSNDSTLMADQGG
ncbi:MAG: hypothetical protein ACI9G6_000854, partial [Limisphaerales bacterium]